MFQHVDRLMQDALRTLEEMDQHQKSVLAACTPKQLATVKQAQSKKWFINQMHDDGTVEMASSTASDYLCVKTCGKYYRTK